MSRYRDGWEFDGRSDEYLLETFQIWDADQGKMGPLMSDMFKFGKDAIIEECHARALVINKES